MRKVFVFIIILIALGFVVVGSIYGIYLRPFLNKMEQTQTIQYDKNLTLVLGGGGNSGILVSDSAVLVIDTKMGKAAEQLYKTVKELAGNKPIIVVNTHVHTDHTGGNKYYKSQTIIAGGNYDKEFWSSDAGADAPPTVWVKDSLVLHIGDETVTIFNLPFPAHTQSDMFVYLHNRKMLFGGDVILNKQSPALLSRYKADPEGYLKAFDLLQARFDIDKVVPGHGNFGGPEIINNYRTFFNDMKAAAANPSIKGEVINKYKDWGQLPFVMSPGATISCFEKSAH